MPWGDRCVREAAFLAADKKRAHTRPAASSRRIALKKKEMCSWQNIRTAWPGSDWNKRSLTIFWFIIPYNLPVGTHSCHLFVSFWKNLKLRKFFRKLISIFPLRQSFSIFVCHQPIFVSCFSIPSAVAFGSSADVPVRRSEEQRVQDRTTE